MPIRATKLSATYRDTELPHQKVAWAWLCCTDSDRLWDEQSSTSNQSEARQNLRQTCCPQRSTRRRLWATSRPSQSTNPRPQRHSMAGSPSSTTTRQAPRRGSPGTNRAHCPSSLPIPRSPNETRARLCRRMTSSCLSVQSRDCHTHPAKKRDDRLLTAL
jgi:hypothetical protein